MTQQLEINSCAVVKPTINSQERDQLSQLVDARIQQLGIAHNTYNIITVLLQLGMLRDGQIKHKI